MRSPSPRTTTCLRSATSEEGNRGREEADGDERQEGGRREVDNEGVSEGLWRCMYRDWCQGRRAIIVKDSHVLTTMKDGAADGA